MMTLDATKDIAPNYTMTIKVVGLKKFRLRLWMAKILFKIGARITNMGIKFEEQPWYGADL